MSDLHGCLKEWEDMLEKIQFSENDTMYVLGDVIDKGKNPVKLLRKIMTMDNVMCLMGNHEYDFLKMFYDLLTTPAEHRSFILNTFKVILYDNWKFKDGLNTCQEFKQLSIKEGRQIGDYIKSMKLYYEITVNDCKYILSHSGLGNYGKEKSLEEYKPSELLKTNFCDLSYGDDNTIIIGHTPTFLCDSNFSGRIYKEKGIINVDCGAVFRNEGGCLGCIRLDDMQEFYV